LAAGGVAQLDGELGGEFFEFGLALVAEIDRGAGGGDFEAADLSVERGDGAEERVDGADVVGDLRIEIGLHLREAAVGALETIGEDRGVLEQRLARADIGGAGGEGLERSEKAIQRGAESAGGSRGRLGAAGGADGLAEAGLGALVAGLLGVERGFERDLAHELAVDERVAELLRAEDFEPEALHAGGRHDRTAVTEDDALPGVGRVVHVRQILARSFQRAAVGVDRLHGSGETGVEAGHGGGALGFKLLA
jgi:hypothetical protein